MKPSARRAEIDRPAVVVHQIVGEQDNRAAGDRTEPDAVEVFRRPPHIERALIDEIVRRTEHVGAGARPPKAHGNSDSRKSRGPLIQKSFALVRVPSMLLPALGEDDERRERDREGPERVRLKRCAGEQSLSFLSRRRK